jgi:4-amino-4-deoxychorismate lyase
VTDLKVVAVLGVGVISSDTPILRADDLGVVRGDGIFETMHVRRGVPWLLDEHLARMRRSAERTELDLPPREALAELAAQAVAAWPSDREGALRVICTRGSETNPGPVTVFATVGGVSEASIRARTEGIRVLTAAFGMPAGLRATSPWLLGGAKTLSYAVNMASQRWAAAHGAQDVLWVSSDGYVLEAPTATLVWRQGSQLCMVPAEKSGILPGTTARYAFDHAAELGWDTAEEMISPDALLRCDGAWLLSSVRGIAPVRTLDGTTVAHSTADTTALRELLGF